MIVLSFEKKTEELNSKFWHRCLPGGKDVKKGRQTVFFTAVNLMFAHLQKQQDYDVAKPRIAVYKQNWKIHQSTVYWGNLGVAQKKGLTFYQTRSDAINLHNTLPAACIEKVEEIKKKKKKQRMNSTFGIGPRAQNCLLGRLG